MSQVFDFFDYTEFLKNAFSGVGAQRGSRLKLAEHLNCQPSFLTQVFSGKVQLSFEHAYTTCEYLNFSPAEKDYFMLLVQKGRAGSKKLVLFYQEKIQSILKERDLIKNRMKVDTNLSVEDQMKYYSTWFYSSIHILTSVPGLHNPESIAERLNLDILLIKQALEFLVLKGFVQIKNNQYHIGNRRIHLTKGSEMLPRHHTNWRQRAIDAVDYEKEDELHFTGVLGIAKKDMKIFKSRLLKLLEDLEPVISESNQDTQVILLLDLFEK